MYEDHNGREAYSSMDEVDHVDTRPACRACRGYGYDFNGRESSEDFDTGYRRNTRREELRCPMCRGTGVRDG